AGPARLARDAAPQVRAVDPVDRAALRAARRRDPGPHDPATPRGTEGTGLATQPDPARRGLRDHGDDAAEAGGTPIEGPGAGGIARRREDQLRRGPPLGIHAGGRGPRGCRSRRAYCSLKTLSSTGEAVKANIEKITPVSISVT